MVRRFPLCKLVILPAYGAILLLTLAITCCTNHAAAQSEDGEFISWHFATQAESRKLLQQNDDFTQRLSKFDRSARLKTSKSVSEEQHRQFTADAAREWPDEEKVKFQPVLIRVAKRVKELSLPIPKKITLIKTSGDEEGRAPYTRGRSIIIPANRLGADEKRIEKLLYHELFHIASRSNVKFRDQVYSLIGFQHCGELDFPSSLKDRKLTNPDAPINQHCIKVNHEGKSVWVVPILFSKTEAYDENRGGEFFNYLTFKLLIVNRDETTAKLNSPNSDTPPKLISPNEAEGFFDQIGMNTGYIIHPEEILADNFSILAMRSENVKSPKLLQRIGELLEKWRQ